MMKKQWKTSKSDMKTIHFGASIIELDIPKKNLAFNLKANNVKPPKDEVEEIRQSILNPIGCKRLRDMVSKNDSIVILADDRTRLTPQKKIIPVVLEELYEAGLKSDQIKIIIAYGTHRVMTSDEKLDKFGKELMSTIEIKDHNCLNIKNLIDKGKTRRGTRILINKEVLDADFRIAIGSVLPHHPTGWSGGAKILLPGVAGQETICSMHLLGANEPQLGKVLTPCREEMEDFAQAVGLHFIVNIVHDKDGNILKSVAGHFVEAHRKAVEHGFEVFGAKFHELADITLSSTYPADYDLTQSDKGLFSAELATKTGGEIILLSPCLEGIAPTHGEEMAKLARYDDTLLWAMLDKKKIKDPFCASENMYLNHIKKTFKTTLMMQPMLTNIMGFYHLSPEELPNYIRYRLKLDNTLKIGVLNQSSEILPIPAGNNL
jgi:nickel-dependent lactate racemase